MRRSFPLAQKQVSRVLLLCGGLGINQHEFALGRTALQANVTNVAWSGRLVRFRFRGRPLYVQTWRGLKPCYASHSPGWGTVAPRRCAENGKITRTLSHL